MNKEKVQNIGVTDVAGYLAKKFLYNPLTALLAVFLIAIGVIALEVMPREEDPQIAISGGSVIVPAPGLKPKQIEKIIVEPLEQRLREIKGVEHIYSMSMDNMAVVNVMYYIGQNREISNLKLYDKVMQNMDQLPKEVMQPLIKPFDIDIDIPIVNIAFYRKNKDLDYNEFIKIIQNLKQDISTIENVSKTQLKGAKKQQFNVSVDLGKLKGYNVSLGQIVKAIESITINVPDVKSKTPQNELVIFGVKNAIESIEDVKKIIVTEYFGSPIYLKDIARVSDGFNYQDKKEVELYIKESGSFIKHNQVTLTVSKLGGTNAVLVAEDVLELLTKNNDILNSHGIGYILTRDYGQRANAAVNDLMESLIITIFIIAIVLMFFLGWKESLIVTFMVPAILAITLFVAYLTDQTVNRITLFAFLLSLGLLVDAAIIVIENIYRHMHEENSEFASIDELLIKATDEIGAPTNIATFAIILTMVPMAFVGGMMGEFMKPIPLNVPVALLASLAVAYIFTPYLSKKLMKKGDSNEV